MNGNRFFSSIVLLILFSAGSYAQKNKPMTDYLQLPGPVMFLNKAYNLSWTSHPSDHFYKHEYIQKGDNADRFNSMLLFDITTSNMEIKDIVAMKLKQLKEMQASNPLVKYETFQKNGEYMIDFLLSSNAPDGSTAVVERNVYRYKKITDKSGKAAIALFGVSTRSYGADINDFLNSLKNTRPVLTNAVAAFVFPAIALSN